MRYTIISLLLVMVLNVPVFSLEYGTTPKLNHGAKWRIGYYEGGEYDNYPMFLTATIKGLMDMGWIEKSDIPVQQGVQTTELWNWLANKSKSSYLQFQKNAHYTANWDKNLRKQLSDQIIQRFNKEKDIDLMIAMGTWAGKDLANNNHKTPIIVLSCSDAIGSGIVKSIDDSGYDHVHARVDPFRYERQIWVFYNVIGFKKLGIAYEDSVESRSYAAIDTVKKVAKAKGFEIEECLTIAHNPDVHVCEESVIKCFKELVTKVNAIYLTVQGGVNASSIPQLVKIANDNRIPTFSQAGKDEVKQGVLMTISPADYRQAGNFHAAAMAKIFNGAAPRQLPMYFKETFQWEFNFETAKKIGLDLSSLNMESDYSYFPDF